MAAAYPSSLSLDMVSVVVVGVMVVTGKSVVKGGFTAGPDMLSAVNSQLRSPQLKNIKLQIEVP